MWTDVGRDREQERQRKMRDKRSEQPDKDSDQMMRRAGFWMVFMLGAAAVCILCPFCLHLFQCLQLHSLVSDDAISNRKQMRSVNEDSNFLEGLQCQAQQIGLGFKLTNYDLVL
jgi:cytochrome c-type biogenesis protein CcmH/NrfG